MLSFAGVAGEAHGSDTRPACGRASDQYPEGTTIRNVRQLSVLSAEEMALIAAQLELAAIDPCTLGASMVLAGLPDLTQLPPLSRLQAPRGVTLVVDMENRPCNLPAKEIEK